MNRQSIIRLSKYKNTLQRLKTMGFVKVFSDNLADALGIRSTQVRKDFSQFNITGNKRGGYVIDELLEKILRILGKTHTQRVVLIGIGNIGRALLHYKGFENEGINIDAVFDINTDKPTGRDDLNVYSMDKLVEFIQAEKIEVAVIAVPDMAAQRVFDLLLQAGIKGVLNFAPIRLRGPENVPVTNVNLVLEIENLFCFVNAAKEE